MHSRGADATGRSLSRNQAFGPNSAAGEIEQWQENDNTEEA